MDLVPIGMVGDAHPEAITGAPRGVVGEPMDSSASLSSGSARNTGSGTDVPAGPSRATSKQNDLRRMSKDHTVDLALVREACDTHRHFGQRQAERPFSGSGLGFGPRLWASPLVLRLGLAWARQSPIDNRCILVTSRGGPPMATYKQDDENYF